MSLDCVIVGAGHNGLVCAAILAKAGRSVTVVEAAEEVGGAARTREFAPGFRVSAGAHLLHAMPAGLVRELNLSAHGLQWAAQSMSTTVLSPDAQALVLGNGAPMGLSGDDAQAYSVYSARMSRFAAALVPMFSSVPARFGTADWGDKMALLSLAWRIRRLGRRDMRELLRIIGMNAFDLLQENFSSPALKGALGLDAVLGTNFGPRSPGTVLTLLYRLAGQAAAGPIGLCQPVGGMGAVCDALAGAARAAGADIRTSSPVRQILIEGDRAVGVRLESGEIIRAHNVVSNADPKTTFLDLIGPQHLDTGFVRRVHHIRSKGLAAKLHLALKQMPNFTGVPPQGLKGRLVIAPSLQHIEHAYNHSKYGEYSAEPVMEITLPTANDPTLAPAQSHVLSAIVQYAPHTLKSGWQSGRQGFQDAALDVLERAAPGIRDSVLEAELLTPADIEAQFRIFGGHWHHGDLAFDQFLMVRPVPGAAQHRTPVPGVFLCGAGCHPGGGVAGVAGRNAAGEILKSGNRPS